jgi:hypothetical protein
MSRFSKIAAALTLVACVCAAQGTGAGSTTDYWSWLPGTYWFVPASNLPAMLTSSALPKPVTVLDQTVFHIQEYQGGYFWGAAVVQISVPIPGTSSTPSAMCMSFTGSVTPEGAVLISFTPATSTSRTPGTGNKTQGTGAMRFVSGQWTMEMQMSTGNQGELSHWAYMNQCKSGDPCNQTLPGLQVGMEQLFVACAHFIKLP